MDGHRRQDRWYFIRLNALGVEYEGNWVVGTIVLLFLVPYLVKSGFDLYHAFRGKH